MTCLRMKTKNDIKELEVGQRDRQKRSVHAVASLNDIYKKVIRLVVWWRAVFLFLHFSTKVTK